MKLISAVLFLALGYSVTARAAIHNLENSLRAVKSNQTNTQLLIYKVRNQTFELNQQQWQPFLSRQVFRTSGLLRQLARISGANNEFGRYFVRQYSTSLTDAEAASVLRDMFRDANIEFAYFEPRVSDAVALERMQQTQALAGQKELENFEATQFHLSPAPEGVDARYGWSLPGGTGKRVRIIDVETGWHTNHFEFGPVFYDNGKNALSDHGTAVWGEVAARPDGKGVTGIAYDVEWGIAGHGMNGGGFENYPATIASVIETAVVNMRAGDILVIEQHAVLVGDFGPIEYFEPVFKVLQAATAKGVHCIAAAGNGYSNLDDPKYNGAFDITVRDSGCILVGAADSPQSSRARQRSDFSDYGSRVDAFGYGENVVTSGYGDLWSGNQQNKLATYTNSFSGTSSATPIVTGAVASVLGIAKAKGVVITPQQMREALHVTGTSQEGVNKSTQRIGNLPSIPQLVEHFGL